MIEIFYGVKLYDLCDDLSFELKNAELDEGVPVFENGMQLRIRLVAWDNTTAEGEPYLMVDDSLQSIDPSNNGAMVIRLSQNSDTKAMYQTSLHLAMAELEMAKKAKYELVTGWHVAQSIL